MQTYKRTRKHGTVETVAGNPADRMSAIRKVVAEKTYAKVDGTMIDLFTASAIVNVYDALSDPNKAKFSSLPAGKMGILAFSVLNRAKSDSSVS